MAQIPQAYLFDWTQVEAASDLDRLRLVLEVVPDEPLVQALEAARDRGRNDYPVRPVWNSILAGAVFQHPPIASLRRELRRNAELRYVCGFDPARGERAVPSDPAYSHFLGTLLDHEPLIQHLFHSLVTMLEDELPDLGRSLAFDGKALPSFANPRRAKDSPETRDGAQASKDAPAPCEADAPDPAHKSTPRPDRRRDDDADWGKKTYRGVHADGSAWRKVVKWFGFQLHLLVDARYELPLAYEVQKASASEMIRLVPLVEQTAQHHPALVERTEDLSADKGLDSTDNCRDLFDRYVIKPVIDKRADWQDPDPTRPLYPDRVDTIVYDVKGHVSCVCPATQTQRPLSPWGFEPDRGTLKYRCPAAAQGLTCEGRAQCPGAQGAYGRVVRIPLEQDRRMFTPIARDSRAWTRAYKRRTAVERTNSRIDQVLGFERHTIRGLAKMPARVGIALVVLLAMALGRIRRGQAEKMRSLVAPVPKRAA